MKVNTALAGLLAVVLLAAGCGPTNTPDQAAAPSSKPTVVPPVAPPAAPPPANTPDFKVTAKDIASECRKDVAAAKAKYKGKRVEITGKVDEIAKRSGGAIIALQAEVPNDPFVSGPTAMFRDRSLLGQLGRDQIVTLIGVVEDLPRMPNLENCSLVAKGADTIAHLTAEKLAEEFATDPNATVGKYRPLTLIVSGTVAALNPSPYHVIKFQVPGKKIIEGNFGDTGGLPKDCKVGDKLTCVVNKIRWEGGDKLMLEDCYPLPQQ